MSYWDKIFNERISRRRTLAVLGGGAAAAAFIAACGGDDGDDDDSSSSQGGASGSDTPKPGGNFRIGTTFDLLGPDPHVTGSFNPASLWQIVEGLITYDEQLKPVPVLATKFEQTDGGATLIFTLRPGVKWHSGREFTSDDVVFNMERTKDPNVPLGQFRGMAGWFTVTAPDKLTVVMKSDAPRPSAFDLFNNFRMADRETVGQLPVIGTGPWKFGEWQQATSLTMVKNPSYWDPALPYFDQITWSLPLDPEAANAHLEANALDAIFSPSINGFARLQDNNQFHSLLHPSPGRNHTIGFNLQDKPFDDKRVRQAFNWSIDRIRLQDVVFKKTTVAHSLPWPKNSLAYEESKAQFYKFDLKKAADLLRAANVNDLTTGATSHRALELSEFLPVWQNDLKQIGVNLRIDMVEPAAFPPIVNGLQHHSLWAASTSNAASGSPVSLFVLGATTWGGDGKNNVGFKDDKWQELIGKAATEIDTTKAKAIYSELNDMILDSSHLIPVGPSPARFLANAKVKGLGPTSNDAFHYHKAWFS